MLFLDLALSPQPQPPYQFNKAIMIPSFPLAKLFLSVCVTVEDFAYISYTAYTSAVNLCCGSGRFIPDPNFSIPDPGSRVQKILDPGPESASKYF